MITLDIVSAKSEPQRIRSTSWDSVRKFLFQTFQSFFLLGRRKARVGQKVFLHFLMKYNE